MNIVNIKLGDLLMLMTVLKTSLPWPWILRLFLLCIDILCCVFQYLWFRFYRLILWIKFNLHLMVSFRIIAGTLLVAERRFIWTINSRNFWTRRTSDEADISVNVEERMDVKARVLRHATDWPFWWTIRRF